MHRLQYNRQMVSIPLINNRKKMPAQRLQTRDGGPFSKASNRIYVTICRLQQPSKRPCRKTGKAPLLQKEDKSRKGSNNLQNRIPSADGFPFHLFPHAALFFSTPRLIMVSAIWTVLSAAPLRRLSDTTHILRPFSMVASSRMRDTKVAKSPAHSAGVT